MAFQSVGSVFPVGLGIFLAQSFVWFWAVLGILGICAVGVVIWLLVKPKKPTQAQVDQGKIEELIKILGGIKNIDSVMLDGARLRLSLVNLKLCSFDLLKKFGATGIFVAGKQIKFILKEQSKETVQAINLRIKER